MDVPEFISVKQMRIQLRGQILKPGFDNYKTIHHHLSTQVQTNLTQIINLPEYNKLHKNNIAMI